MEKAKLLLRREQLLKELCVIQNALNEINEMETQQQQNHSNEMEREERHQIQPYQTHRPDEMEAPHHHKQETKSSWFSWSNKKEPAPQEQTRSIVVLIIYVLESTRQYDLSSWKTWLESSLLNTSKEQRKKVKWVSDNVGNVDVVLYMYSSGGNRFDKNDVVKASSDLRGKRVSNAKHEFMCWCCGVTASLSVKDVDGVPMAMLRKNLDNTNVIEGSARQDTWLLEQIKLL